MSGNYVHVYCIFLLIMQYYNNFTLCKGLNQHDAMILIILVLPILIKNNPSIVNKIS